MNKYYSYPNIDLWYGDKWEDRLTKINGLVQWMGGNTPFNDSPYAHRDIDDPTKDKYYYHKAFCINEPEVIDYWKEKGIRLTTLCQGRKRWISMVPEKAIADREHNRLPALIVFHKEHYSDPWWAMRTVNFYKEYNEYLAAHPDFMIIYLVTEGADTDRIYLNILQEAFVLYPTDLGKLYFDVSYAVKSGKKLSDIEGFYYTDEDGTPSDPDKNIESFGPCKSAINLARRWDNCDSLARDLIIEYGMNKGGCDREALVHSYAGKRFMDGIALEHRFNTINDDGYAEYWDKMGLKFDIHFYKGERWLTLTPKSAIENPEEKIPVILVLQEVYEGNEHLAVTASSYFYELCEIAAQGECMLLFFVMEDVENNELLVPILKEAEGIYPIDASRVYATGHSHDGYFTYEFFRRHHDIVAAAATLGYGKGLIVPGTATNSIFFPDDFKLETLHNAEMPIINITGSGEGYSAVPNADDDSVEVYAENWRRRLYASNCPSKTTEEIREAIKNGDTVEKKLGIPADHTEALWAYGARHFIADVNNVNGKAWLRIVVCENMPHTTNPFMLNLAWSFMRRFARDLETGKTIELY